jgi:hypothetical protein
MSSRCTSLDVAQHFSAASRRSASPTHTVGRFATFEFFVNTSASADEILRGLILGVAPNAIDVRFPAGWVGWRGR